MITNDLAPKQRGLIASRVMMGTWLGRPGASWTYHHPDDCRSSGPRLHVQVWRDGIGSFVSVCEGDGVKSFRRAAMARLPDNSAEAVASATAWARPHLKPSTDPSTVAARAAAATLVQNGYSLGEAGRLPGERVDGRCWVRDAPGGIEFIRDRQTRTADLLSEDAQVEVGICLGGFKGATWLWAPSLQEAIAAADRGDLCPPRFGEFAEVESPSRPAAFPAR